MDNKIFQFPVRVYYEDTDAGGVVYHSQYLNFMERARTEWLRSFGLEQTILKVQDSILFVVHSMQLVYKKPARFDDLLYINSCLLEMKRSSFSCHQQILRGDTVLLDAQVKIACVDTDLFKPTGIPSSVQRALESS